jgi:tetratricopeptide (TPR) repeat protein
VLGKQFSTIQANSLSAITDFTFTIVSSTALLVNFLFESAGLLEIKKPSAEELKREIHYLIQRGRSDEILDPARVMAKKFPKDAAYLMLISEQFFKEGELELSLDLMKAYCKGNPSDLNAQSNLGMLLEMLGKENEAMLLYEKILKADPNQAHTKDLYDKLMARMN